MKLRFVLSGSLIATAESDCVPLVGSEVIVSTQSYKKGVTPGSLIRFKVSDESPPIYDYSIDPAEVSIDVNGYEVLKEGQHPIKDTSGKMSLLHPTLLMQSLQSLGTVTRTGNVS